MLRYCSVKAFIGHLKYMHFLAKQEIAHTNFTPLVKSLGATYLVEIALGQNWKYTSECFMQEIVSAMGEAALEPIKEEIQSSPVFSLLIDETTDVSIIKQKQMTVYGHYILNGKTKTRFLGKVELSL